MKILNIHFRRNRPPSEIEEKEPASIKAEDVQAPQASIQGSEEPGTQTPKPLSSIQESEQEGLSLVPLTPLYSEGSHRVYVDALNRALKDPHNLNIALSGHYGVGKSSILSQVVTENGHLKIVTVSLSSLRMDSKEEADSTTNRIQKEIVKQLLYREAPTKTPASRYKRLGQYDQVVEFPALAIVAFFLYIGAYVSGQMDKLIPFREQLDQWVIVLQYLEVFLIMLLLLLIFRRATHSRIWLDKLTAGSASLTLAKPADTYFDDFLDELVYFFEVSKTQVVVFEDIDRFDNPRIFDNLKALNSLLNTAGQIRRQRIRFIYAIRDSIFESTDEEVDLASSRSNRTKFFDLVVPVVPFITHNNARDLMTSVMRDVEHKVSPSLIRIAARHVSDMRVLKNVRNEFLIFRERILANRDPREVLGLSEENLFAMILYKNTHLSDFEKVSTAKSDLDAIYSESRKVVNAEINRLTAQEASLNQRLAGLNSIESRSAQLGSKLRAVLDTLQKQMTGPYGGMSRWTLSLDGNNLSEAKLELVETWTALLRKSAKLKVTFHNANNQNIDLNFGQPELGTILDEALSPVAWQKVDRAALEEQIRILRVEIEAIRKADIADLMRINPEWTSQSKNKVARSFTEYVDGCLGSELAVELAKGGFIDRNFTLYTSVYHGIHVSVPAKNFIMKCIEQQISDPEFALQKSDVEAVLSEINEELLSFRGAYNISLLDHLLASRDGRSNVLVRALAKLGQEEREFLRSYWMRGTEQMVLAFELAKISPQVLDYLITDDSVPDLITLPDPVSVATK